MKLLSMAPGAAEDAAPSPAAAMGRGDTGNKGEKICVAVRMRPLSAREEASSGGSAWRASAEHNKILKVGEDGEHEPSDEAFDCPCVLDVDATNRDVYDRVGVGDMVKDVTRGYNVAIFTYGQTASGKTHTMRGRDGGEEGIVQMAARDIFDHIQGQLNARQFLVKASFVEVYNEKVRDLLVPPGDGSRLKVRLGGDGFQVEAKERVARCTADLVSIASEGEKSRSVGSTEMNVRSSRSHTIFRIVVECASDGERALSTLCLVDLAGSESSKHTGATGDRQREGGKINQSLLALSRVINKLAENGKGEKKGRRKEEPPWRDSVLTMILKPSLSGNARVAVICCATPSAAYADETKSTLQFASRARDVETRAVRGRRRLTAPTKSSAAFSTPKKRPGEVLRRVSAKMSSLSPNRPRARRCPRTDIKAGRFSSIPEDNDETAALRRKVVEGDLRIASLRETVARKDERIAVLVAKLQSQQSEAAEELRAERSESEWLRSRVEDLEISVSRLESDREFLEEEAEARGSTSPRGVVDVDLGREKDPARRESSQSDSSGRSAESDATEDLVIADWMKGASSAGNSYEMIVAELERDKGRVLELEALVRKLRRKTESPAYWLGPSDGRALEPEAPVLRPRNEDRSPASLPGSLDGDSVRRGKVGGGGGAGRASEGKARPAHKIAEDGGEPRVGSHVSAGPSASNRPSKDRGDSASSPTETLDDDGTPSSGGRGPTSEDGCCGLVASNKESLDGTAATSNSVGKFSSRTLRNESNTKANINTTPSGAAEAGRGHKACGDEACTTGAAPEQEPRHEGASGTEILGQAGPARFKRGPGKGGTISVPAEEPPCRSRGVDGPQCLTGNVDAANTSGVRMPGQGETPSRSVGAGIRPSLARKLRRKNEFPASQLGLSDDRALEPEAPVPRPRREDGSPASLSGSPDGGGVWRGEVGGGRGSRGVGKDDARSTRKIEEDRTERGSSVDAGLSASNGPSMDGGNLVALPTETLGGDGVPSSRGRGPTSEDCRCGPVTPNDESLDGTGETSNSAGNVSPCTFCNESNSETNTNTTQSGTAEAGCGRKACGGKAHTAGPAPKQELRHKGALGEEIPGQAGQARFEGRGPGEGVTISAPAEKPPGGGRGVDGPQCTTGNADDTNASSARMPGQGETPPPGVGADNRPALAGHRGRTSIGEGEGTNGEAEEGRCSALASVSRDEGAQRSVPLHGRKRQSSRVRKATDHYSPSSHKARAPALLQPKAEQAETNAKFGCVGYRFQKFFNHYGRYDGVVIKLLEDGRVIVNYPKDTSNYGTEILTLDELPKPKPRRGGGKCTSSATAEREDVKPSVNVLSRPKPQRKSSAETGKYRRSKKAPAMKGRGAALLKALQEEAPERRSGEGKR